MRILDKYQKNNTLFTVKRTSNVLAKWIICTKLVRYSALECKNETKIPIKLNFVEYFVVFKRTVINEALFWQIYAVELYVYSTPHCYQSLR